MSSPSSFSAYHCSAAAAAYCENSYELPGGVIVKDRTNGLVKVFYSHELTDFYNDIAYNFSVQGNQVIQKVDKERYRLGVVIRSVSIILEHKGDHVEVTEEDHDSTPNQPNKYYIKLQRLANGAFEFTDQRP